MILAENSKRFTRGGRRWRGASNESSSINRSRGGQMWSVVITIECQGITGGGQVQRGAGFTVAKILSRTGGPDGGMLYMAGRPGGKSRWKGRVEWMNWSS